MSENVQKFRVFKATEIYPMLVNETMIDFMVDSREARSTIRPCDLPCEPRMTDLVFESTSVGMKMCVRFQLACQKNKCSCI